MKIALIVIGVCLLLGIIVLSSAAYVVNEWDQVVITQFGEAVGKPITQPGLHFKTPFVQKAIYFEKRILEWDGETREVLTGDKKRIVVNTWARWRIVNPLKFYVSLETIRKGLGRLDERIESNVRKVIKTHSLMEVLRNTKRDLAYISAELEKSEKDRNISIEIGRDKITEEILAEASKDLMENLGIELIDIKIKHINYVPAVISTIYSRMRAERMRIKDRYESEGNMRREEIEGEIAREKARIEAEGYTVAKEIRGKADAKALKIYADAFGKDPEFYSFLKTLETYEKTFGRSTQLILSTDSEFFKYLKGYLKE